MKADIVAITPEIASQWLSHNECNRLVRAGKVASYARDMLAGKFVLNGETIKFNGDRLLDGQHRLYACVKAGTPFRSLVVRGVDNEMFATIDAGIPRLVADAVLTAGHKYARTLAAAIRLVVAHETGRLSNNSYVDLSHTETLEALEQRPGIKNSVELAECRRGPVSTPVAAMIHYLLSTKNQSFAFAFVLAMHNGAGLTTGDPYLLLRERLTKDKLSKSKLPRQSIIALTIKACNFAIRGQKCLNLRHTTAGAKPEEFPMLALNELDRET